MIRYNEILKLNCTRINLDKPIDFKGVCIDSRLAKKDYLFFAIKGDVFDAHNFIGDIIKSKKASAFVVNKKWYQRNKNLYKTEKFIIVEDTIKALGELAKIHKDEMNIPIFFVGGSNGKTTTKELLGAVLEKKFDLLKTEGNYNNHIGLPLTLLKIEDKHNFCLLEAGSNHFGELKYLCDVAEPDYALVTNIGREHLEFFKNLNGVAKEEFEIFNYVNNFGRCCFYNLDDEYIKNYYKKFSSKSFTYAYSGKADVCAKKEGYDKNYHPLISYSSNGKKYKTFINSFGSHSYYNGLAAISVGLYFGIEPKLINNALQEFKSPDNKRMQLTYEKGIMLINDFYNSNPDSVKMGVETINEYKTSGKKHILLSDMLEMGKAAKKEHFEIGRMLKSCKIDFLYTYGENSFEIFRGAKGITNNFYFSDKSEMAEFVKLNIKKGDLLYAKGSRGMKLEEVINQIFKN